jgi:hypothetical protein
VLILNIAVVTQFQTDFVAKSVLRSALIIGIKTMKAKPLTKRIRNIQQQETKKIRQRNVS